MRETDDGLRALGIAGCFMGAVLIVVVAAAIVFSR